MFIRKLVDRLVAVASTMIALALSPGLAHGDFIPLGASGWEFDSPAGVAILPGSTEGDLNSSAGGTTYFVLTTDFGSSFDPVAVRFRTLAATQRQHFFMMTMELRHDVPWVGVDITLIDLLGVNVDIGEAEHPDRAHIHTQHSVDGGPNNDGLTPDPNITAGVASAVYEGFLAASDAWEPSRIRLHDMSTNAYVENTTMRGPMDFLLVIKPIPVPEASSGVLLTLGSLGLLGYAWRRRQRLA